MPRTLVFSDRAEIDDAKEWPERYKTYVSLGWSLVIHRDTRPVHEIRLEPGERTAIRSYNDLMQPLQTQGRTIVSNIKLLKRKNPAVLGWLTRTPESVHAVFNIDDEKDTFDVLYLIRGKAW